MAIVATAGTAVAVGVRKLVVEVAVVIVIGSGAMTATMNAAETGVEIVDQLETAAAIVGTATTIGEIATATATAADIMTVIEIAEETLVTVLVVTTAAVGVTVIGNPTGTGIETTGGGATGGVTSLQDGEYPCCYTV